MYKKNILYFYILLFVIIYAYPEEGDNNNIDKSIGSERIEIIKYGIDTEISDLIKQLEEEKNRDFNKELLKLLQNTHNNTLKSKIVKLFSSLENKSAVDFIFSEIKNNYQLTNEIIVQYIKYISSFQTSEITEYLLTLIHHENNSVANAAIDGIGSSDNNNYGDELLKLLQNPSTDELKKSHLISALGKLKYKKAIKTISEYLENDYNDSRSLKWKACIALGQIGDEESLPIIIKIFSEKDPYLRNYAVEALQYFPENKTEDLIIQGLRDSSWRVRVSAANSLGKMKSEKAVPILIYKIKKDPDIRNVRNAAIKSLGIIKTKEALKFLRDFVLNDRSDSNNRFTAVSVLIQEDLNDSLKTIDKLINSEWEKNTSPLLDYTCKLLSQEKNPKLKSIFLKMLSYTKTNNLKIYGLRGIKLNKFKGLKDKVEELAKDNNPVQIIRIAKDVLKELN